MDRKTCVCIGQVALIVLVDLGAGGGSDDDDNEDC